MTADLRYPVGDFTPVSSLSAPDRAAKLDEIAALPNLIRSAVQGLSEIQLDTAYRPGGWTVRQVVHHVADSHVNAYTRLRLALTETEPTIRPYEESDWARLSDAASGPVETSLVLLEALHTRWLSLFRSLLPGDFARTYRHPASGVHPIDNLVALYSWHGRHHVAHITSLRQRMGW